MFKYILSIALLFFTSLSAWAQSDAYIPSQNCLSKARFLDSCENISLHGKLYTASTNAIVIIVHNSAGIDERHHRYARHLNTLGISAVVLDSWGARGVSNAQWGYVSAGRRGATAHNIVIDVYHTADYFKSKGYSKIGYIGESMGGGVGVLLSKREWQQHFRRVSGKEPITLNAIAALYGNCNERYVYDAYLNVDVLKITGSEDGDTPAKTCKEYSEYANAKGANFKFVELPGQYHDFDAGWPARRANAENPSQCVSEVTFTTIKATKTGKEYPNTTKGWEDWKNDCIIRTVNNTARYGNTGNPNTGFDIWGPFFKEKLN